MLINTTSPSLVAPPGNPKSRPRPPSKHDGSFNAAYNILSVGHLASALFMAAAPDTAATFVSDITATAADTDVLRLLSAGLGLSAAAIIALGEATRIGLGDSDTTERLRLSVAALGIGTTVLSITSRGKGLTPLFFASALAAGVLTAALPLVHVLQSEGGVQRAGRAVKGVFHGIAKHLGSFPRQGLVPVLNTLLTPVLLSTGAVYTFATKR